MLAGEGSPVRCEMGWGGVHPTRTPLYGCTFHSENTAFHSHLAAPQGFPWTREQDTTLLPGWDIPLQIPEDATCPGHGGLVLPAAEHIDPR